MDKYVFVLLLVSILSILTIILAFLFVLTKLISSYIVYSGQAKLRKAQQESNVSAEEPKQTKTTAAPHSHKVQAAVVSLMKAIPVIAAATTAIIGLFSNQQ